MWYVEDSRNGILLGAYRTRRQAYEVRSQHIWLYPDRKIRVTHA